MNRIHRSRPLANLALNMGNASRQWPLFQSLMLLLCAGSAGGGAEPGREDWQPYFQSVAKSYRITPDAHPDQPFELLQEPILRWSQPVRGGDDGAVFLWLDGGVPAAMGTVFCWPHRDGYRVVVNEFHSLSEQPLLAERNGSRPWKPRQAGIAWKAFQEAPVPADSAPRRLLQMRQLVGRFRGENVDDQGNGDRWGLRLMPSPLYRFDLSSRNASSVQPVVDGALFALASGTDPEIFILIAARRTETGPQWQWALARFSDRPLMAWLDEQEVLSLPRAVPNVEHVHTYFDIDQLEAPPMDAE
ncbi:MAG: hypothetical protein KDA75_11380 [Planctomycetaceae bacterium]|nr:hypothetical protein [Planctomycetaceae bacterium]